MSDWNIDIVKRASMTGRNEVVFLGEATLPAKGRSPVRRAAAWVPVTHEVMDDMDDAPLYGFLRNRLSDIMDRNLYERANDCRWWALSPVLREGLAAPAGGAGDARPARAARRCRPARPPRRRWPG